MAPRGMCIANESVQRPASVSNQGKCLSASLRTIQLLVGRRTAMRAKAQDRLKRCHRGPAAIEPERKLVKIGLEVRGVDPMMGPPEPGLQIGEDAMDPGQHARGPLGRPLGLHPVPVAQPGQGGIAAPAIGDDRGPGATTARTNPVSAGPGASGTTWRRTRPAARPRTSTAAPTSTLVSTSRPTTPSSGPPT